MPSWGKRVMEFWTRYCLHCTASYGKPLFWQQLWMWSHTAPSSAVGNWSSGTGAAPESEDEPHAAVHTRAKSGAIAKRDTMRNLIVEPPRSGIQTRRPAPDVKHSSPAP